MKKKNIKSLVLSICCMVVCMVSAKLISEVVGPYSKNMYVNGCIGEAILVVLSIVALVLLKKTNILRFKAEGFMEGLMTGAIIPVLAICVFVTVWYEGMTVSATPFEIVAFVIHMIFVGIAEEILFRGIVQTSVMECIGTDSIGKVRIGIVIASVVFASVHLLNAFLPGVSYMDALRQTISVIPVGVLFGAIYFRSKNNIWPGILLHAFNDFYTFLLAGYISSGSFGDAISSTSNSIGGTLIVFLLIDLWLLRKKKLVKCISIE